MLHIQTNFDDGMCLFMVHTHLNIGFSSPV